MTESLSVGTRRSALARAQTGLVLRALSRRRPGLRFRLRPMATSGDADRTPGGSPDFTDALDRALRDGTIDLAVHSAKDLPLEPDGTLRLAAFPRRADPRDCLVVRRRSEARAPVRAARIGSSSLRRRAQLLRWRPDLEVVEIRGNVDRRLDYVRDGRVDGVVVAAAGLVRLGRRREIGRLLPLEEFLPAPAQGALALLSRQDDRRAKEVAQLIDHAPTRDAVTAERAFAAALGGDCRLPVAALARAGRGGLTLDGEVLSSDGRVRLRVHARGSRREAEALGGHAAELLLARGARTLLDSR